MYYNEIYTVDAEECDSAADEEECSVYLQRRKAHRAKLRSYEPHRKFPRHRKRGRVPRFRRGKGKGSGKGNRRRRPKGKGKGKNSFGRPMFRRSPGGFRGRRQRYSLLADHDFPASMAEHCEEVYFKRTGRRRPKGKGKGSSSSSFEDTWGKGSKGHGKGGFGKGFGKGKKGGC